MKIVATIEARMTSSRLPGKVILTANGIPMLGHLVKRLQKVSLIDQIVLATTYNATDDILHEFAQQNDILCFRGSEEDVMQRVIEAGEMARADVIVEITGDCPIIDPLIIEQTIQTFLYNEAEYVNNVIVGSYPVGMDVQVFLLKTLKRSADLTSDPLDHEHVTLHIRNNPQLFSHINLIAPPDLWWPELGLTLDERLDYELLKKVIEYFGDAKPFFSCRDIIKLLRQKPEWVSINQAVTRKGNT